MYSISCDTSERCQETRRDKPCDNHVACHRKPRIAKSVLRQRLVHGGCAGVDVTAHIGHMQSLEKPLERSVLSRWAMQDRKDYIYVLWLKA